MLEIFTSANLAYLPQCMILLDSVRRHEPAARFTLLLVDAIPNDVAVQAMLDRCDEVVLPADLIGPDYTHFLFPYNVVEACTAVKGLGLERLIARGNPTVYLDPDTVLFSPLERVVTALNHHSVVLTPHQMRPTTSLRHLGDEITSLRTGAFNFGFLGVAPTDEGMQVASWWAARLAEHALDDPSSGLFTDQKWGNLIPAMFSGAGVLRDPGMNVASWNLHERRIEIDASGTYLVDGSPLCFFHFTKARNVGSAVSRVKMVGNAKAAHLWGWYLAELQRYDALTPQVGWRFGRYWVPDGAVISVEDRQRFRGTPEELRPLNPFCP